MEYCLGEIPTLGLAGNREVGVDYSTLEEECKPDLQIVNVKQQKKRYSDIDSDDEEILRETKEKLQKKKYYFIENF